MALNIKNREAERLAAEVAALTGESKTEAIRKALEERRRRLKMAGAVPDRAGALERFLREEVWPHVRAKHLGRRVTRRERERILGFGPAGV